MSSLTAIAGAAKLFKEIYGSDFTKACPEHIELIDTFRFEAGDEPGKVYKEAIRMTEEQGYSFRPGNSEATTMRDPVPLRIENAEMLGSVMEFRSRVDVDVFVRATNGGRQAFKNAVGLRQEAQRDSIMRHLEWSLLQGGRTLGVIESLAAGATAVQRLVTITAATWVEGWWAGSENMPLDIFTAPSTSTSTATQATALKRNTSAATAKYRVVTVDFENRTLTLEADNAADWTGVVATDALWRVTDFVAGSGAVTVPGLLRLTEVQSGIINGIDASLYGLWKGRVNNTGGTITMSRILRAVASQGNRSNGKKMFTVRTGPLTWELVNGDLSALRKFDGSYDRGKGYNGFSEIRFYSPHGEIVLRSHPFMRESEVHISDDSKISRRGPSDVRFTVDPNGGEEQMYILLQDVNKYEFRAYSNQGLLNMAPARSTLFTGLTVPTLG